MGRAQRWVPVVDEAGATAKARKAGGDAMQRAADARATDLAPIIAELRAADAESLRAIAAGLDARGIPTARGTGQWSAVQVARAMERAGQ
jgi:hypothetical protein